METNPFFYAFYFIKKFITEDILLINKLILLILFEDIINNINSEVDFIDKWIYNQFKSKKGIFYDIHYFNELSGLQPYASYNKTKLFTLSYDN